MSHTSKKLTSSSKIWQRHALAKACVLAMAGASVVANATSDPIPGAALLTLYGTDAVFAQMTGTYWSIGYNNQWRNIQTNSGSLMAPITGATYFSSLTPADVEVPGGSYPTAITSNSILASAFANQGSNTQTTLNRVSASNDGVLSLNLQIFTGLVNNPDTPTAYLDASSASATLDNTLKTNGTVYIKQLGLGSSNLALSNNAMGASVTLNSLDTTVAVATPSGYASDSKGGSALLYGSSSNSMGSPSGPSAGSTGSVNLSNQQGVFNATGASEVKSVKANVAVAESVGALANSINVNGNSITASTTNNSAVSVFRSTADSAAFTGTVGVTNLQSTNIADAGVAPQSATVTASGIEVDLRNGNSSVTQVTGSVTVNDNKLMAAVLGNAAGAQSISGSIAAGNAIIFDGSSNVTGVNSTRGADGDLLASIGSGSSTAKADLLINSVQRNLGNQFTASLGTSDSGNTISSNLDNLNSGSLTQNGNTLSASVTNNLAGNLISAGQTGSIGSIAASSVLLNTQKNSTVTTLAEVNGALISTKIGATDEIVTGAVTLSNNAITATAQGNLASSSVALKADNLTVGAKGASDGGVLISSTTNAASVMAVSALNVQANDALSLSAENKGSSVGLSFAMGVTPVDLSGTQATVNSNQLSTSATANLASNRITLQSTNAAGLNAGLGSLQSNTGGGITASSGLADSALIISMAAGDVDSSQLTLNSNSITAQAQLNSVYNSLSSSQTTTSGVALATAPSATAVDWMEGNLNASAGIALVNAQRNTSTSANASSYGEMTVTAGALGSATASSLQLNSNKITAAADGNTATSALTLNNGSMSDMTTALVSGQRGSNTDVTTKVVGEISVTSGSVGSASVVSVNDNTIKSTAASSSSSNNLTVSATNASGTGLTFTPVASYATNDVAIFADMALMNFQFANSSAVSATTGTNVSSPAQIALTTAAVGSGANLTLNGNTLAATANVNSANNTSVIAIGSIVGMSAGLGNVQQSVDSAAVATTYGKVDANLNNITGSNVSVNLNAVTAAAMGNTVANSLSITANNTSGRGVSPSFIYPIDRIQADNFLSNAQYGQDITAVATTAGDVTLTSGGAVGGASNVSLNSNTISAYGSSNYAANDLLVAVNNLSNSSSALLSSQISSRTAEIDSVMAFATGTVALQASAVSASNLAMNGNTIKSTALDNVSVNQLTLTSTTATGTSGATMTGLSSMKNDTEVSSVTADASLINLQSSRHVGSLKANTGVSDPTAISTEITGPSTGATVTANNNTLSSLVFANNGSNALAMSVTTLTAMTGALSNTQTVDNGALDAKTMGDIKLTSTGAVDTASLTLKGNSIAATADANEASNSFTVVATDVVGRNVGSRITNAAALAVASDFALGNEQQLTSGTSVNAASKGDVHLNVATNAVGTSKVALSDNSLSAYGSGNNASNQLSMVATNISQSSLGLASNQSMDAASAVTSAVDGSVKLTAGAVTSSNASATGNTIKSTALGNVASNSLLATASSYAGSAALPNTVSYSAGVLVEESFVTSTTADLAIANVQNNASTAPISAITTGTVQIAASGAVGVSEGGAASSLALTGNTLKALAQSNSASNEIKLNITEFTGATAGVVSYQNSAAEVSASLAPKVSGLFAITTGDVTGASISVSSNTASALAGINEAFNTLTVTGANLLGRGADVSSSVGTASSTGADFAVMNAQSASTSAAATVDVGTSGFSTSGSFTGGNVGVTGNAVLARASANTANNALTLAATNRLEASGVVNNVQTMADDATVNATVSTGAAIGAEFGIANGGAVVTVKDNTVTAQATGNVANNALNATATSGIAAAGSSATSPTFAVLNSQSTGTSATGIQSAINGITVGGTALNGALNGGSFSASGNQLLSVAYGNSANNAVVVSALAPGLNTASASITNVQYNMASINASVSGVNVQASGTVGTTGGSVNINGNSTIAMAVGNRSVNSITGR